MNIGNPIFRFTLNNSVDGSLIISEPDGWTKSILKLERHEDYHSLIEYFTGSFIFYGNNGDLNGGIDYILAIERAQGFEAIITILIEVSFDSGETYNTIFNGQLDLTGIQHIKDNKIEVPIIRNDFWTKFILRNEIPVAINSNDNLDGGSSATGDIVTLNLSSQIINQSMEDDQDIRNDMGNDWTGTPPSASPNIDFNQNQYVTFDLDKNIIDEITTRFHYGTNVTDDLPLPIFVLEFDGKYTIEISISITFKNLQTGGPVHYEYTSMSVLSATFQHAFRLYIQINDDAPIEIPYTSHSQAVTPFTSTHTFTPTSPGLDAWDNFYYLDTLDLLRNDNIRIYFKVENAAKFYEQYNGVSALLFQPVILGVDNSNIQWSDLVTNLPFQATGPPASDPVIPSFIKVKAGTLFKETQSESFFAHDVAFKVLDRILDNSLPLYSEYFGGSHTLGTYSQDGCAQLFTLTRGLQLRQYSLSEKPFSISFKQFWGGMNPIFNLGLCYETISSNEVIRLEDKGHFYDKINISVYIDNVRDIVREYDVSRIFNSVEIGYNKWQDQIISGLDDPQTKHTYATVIKKIKNNITLYSDFIAASLAIENTRRTNKVKSSDYKFDDDTFIIAVKETDPGIFFPELDENFDSVTNLLNSETRYNISLTPLRNLIRWYNYLSGCLQKYLSGSFKFTYGEGNFDMQSDYSGSADGICYNKISDNLAENGDLSLSYNSLLGFLHLPDLFTITIDLSWEDYLAIRTNHKKAIGISQTTTGHKKFFIKSLEYTICESKAKIIAWSAEEFVIQIIQ